ncbi:hypothetical protein O181_090352 [Austropuccinia psidii MF-1]|uniref:Peptidase A2 domain-containing protein n=1 Tax=Austropuccinia psidii MF-1 TaxID=1389203 RepID=A0A9Q3IVD0_9BASI|nr:hypothetical protein [Austropuccinia psidii MF-1]
MEIFIGKEEYPIKALVDTGAEINIIPEEIAIKASLTTRNLNMNLRDEETESNLENEYNYLYLLYITFEDIYGDEAQENLCEDKYLCHLPGANLNNIQFLYLLTEEEIKGNLENQFWDEIFEMATLPRRGLYFNQIWAQWYLGLNGSKYQTGRLKWVGDGYIFIDEDLWWSEFPSEPEIEERNAFVESLKDLILARLLNRHLHFPLGGVQL